MWVHHLANARPNISQGLGSALDSDRGHPIRSRTPWSPDGQRSGQSCPWGPPGTVHSGFGGPGIGNSQSFQSDAVRISARTVCHGRGYSALTTRIPTSASGPYPEIAREDPISVTPYDAYLDFLQPLDGTGYTHAIPTACRYPIASFEIASRSSPWQPPRARNRVDPHIAGILESSSEATGCSSPTSSCHFRPSRVPREYC